MDGYFSFFPTVSDFNSLDLRELKCTVQGISTKPLSIF